MLARERSGGLGGAVGAGEVFYAEKNFAGVFELAEHHGDGDLRVVAAAGAGMSR